MLTPEMLAIALAIVFAAYGAHGIKVAAKHLGHGMKAAVHHVHKRPAPRS